MILFGGKRNISMITLLEVHCVATSCLLRSIPLQALGQASSYEPCDLIYGIFELLFFAGYERQAQLLRAPMMTSLHTQSRN